MAKAPKDLEEQFEPEVDQEIQEAEIHPEPMLETSLVGESEIKTYEVVGDYVTVMQGRVSLTKLQAINREHALKEAPLNSKKIKDGDVYELTRPTGFIHGDFFGYDGDLSPSQAREVEEVG